MVAAGLHWDGGEFGAFISGSCDRSANRPTTSLGGTGSRVLVEASPRDRVWGIGLAADDERAGSPERWQGLNLLGFALMEVRHRLRAEQAA